MENKNSKQTRMSRRQMLKTTGQGVTLAALASAVGCSTAGMSGGANIVGSTCLTICYLNSEDATFDFDYYRDNHLTLIMNLYGKDAIQRFELHKPIEMPGAPPSPYLAHINIYIRDAEAFAAAGAEHGPTLVADVANFTNAQLVAQNEIIWGESGGDLFSTELGQTCMAIVYPYEDGARFDPDYYRDNHMTLIMDLYGREAIRRFEVRKPSPMPENSPLFMGSVNFYIESQAAFDAAGLAHTDTLVADVPNFSSVFPLVIPSEIYGLDS